MRKLVLMVTLDAYADWEAAWLASWVYALGRGAWAIKTVSPGAAPVVSMGGFTLLPECDLASAPEDFAGLALIGGMSWRTRAARDAAPLVRRALERKAVVGAICDAVTFLGVQGFLNAADHTCNDPEDLQRLAGEAYTGRNRYRRQPAVRDGKMVTANGTAALEWAREVLLALEVAPEREITALYEFYKRGCLDAPMPGFLRADG